MADDEVRYPSEWEVDVLLRDGTAAHVRPIRPDDADALVAFHARLSAQTIYRRFFSPRPFLPAKDVERFTNVDYRRRLALVATIDDELAAVARYDAVGEQADEAEVAFVIEDRHQGRGLGSLLLEHLAAAARERGYRFFVAETLAENRAMLGVFRDAGFDAVRTFEDGTVHLRFPIDETPRARQAMGERDRRATVESITSLLRPRSIAVIGASRQPGSLSHIAFRNLLMGEVQGPVYPVNATAEHVAGVRASAEVGAIADPVDLAIVAVPAAEVAGVVEACGEKGVRGVVVISAGFAESGEAGAALELDVVRRARRHGMRLVGPTSMGVVNTSPSVGMNATVARSQPAPGRIAVGAQSGALGIAVLQQAAAIGLGVSSFVSLGNKADVSSNDLLQYWEADGETDVILLYLESFGNPRKFASIARRVSGSKPIVAVKGGRGDGRTPDRVIDALFRQTGVIRVDSLPELFDVALVLAHQPVAADRRVAIIGAIGGPNRLAVDACAGAGLVPAELSADTLAALADVVAPGAPPTNPVALPRAATPEEYASALRTVAADPGVDALLAIFTPPLAARPEELADAVSDLSGAAGKPLVTASVGGGGATGLLAGTEDALHPVPVFPFPEPAIRALGRVASYGRWRRHGAEAATEPEEPLSPEAIDAVRRRLQQAVAAGDGTGTEALTGDVLAAAGIELDPDEREGVDVILAVTSDDAFGPVLEFGVRGPVLDLLDDRAVRVVPLDQVDAVELVEEIRAAPLLAGADRRALVDLVLRLSALAERVPELAWLSLDPVTVGPSGATVRRASLRAQPTPLGPSPLLRRLR